MRKQTVYISDDGRQFSSEKDCLERDSLIAKIHQIMSELIPVPDDDGFFQGNGYIQQDPATVDKVKNALLDLWAVDSGIASKARLMPASHSIVGMFMADEFSPLWPAWSRLCRIDARGREWGQRFFAENPGQAQQTRLNP